MKYFTVQHEGQQVKLLRREKDHNLLVGYLEEDTANEVLEDLNTVYVLDEALRSGKIDGMTVVDGKLVLKAAEGEKVYTSQNPLKLGGNIFTHKTDEVDFDEQFEGGVK